jgi:hypothetical protein
MEGYGVFLQEGPQDWQILQQRNGSAAVLLGGSWRVRPEDCSA